MPGRGRERTLPERLVRALKKGIPVDPGFIYQRIRNGKIIQEDTARNIAERCIRDAEAVRRRNPSQAQSTEENAQMVKAWLESLPPEQ